MHDKPPVSALLVNVRAERGEREAFSVLHFSSDFFQAATRAIVPWTLIAGFVITQDSSANDSNGTAFQLSSTARQPTATSVLVS
jgi:hypothetical protein